jgi:hypothetical protein
MKEGTCIQAQDDVFEEQHSQGIEKVQAAQMQEEIDEHSQELKARVDISAGSGGEARAKSE